MLSKGKNKFDFYEIVKVSADCRSLRKVNHCEGVVTSMAQNEDTGEWSYGVTIYDEGGLGWHLMENELLPTGKKADPKDYEPVGSVKILVDPDTGEGTFKDPDWFDKLDDK